MKNIINYRILRSYDTDILEKTVQEYLESGWTLYGDIKVSIRNLHKEDEELSLIQVVVKYKDKEKPKIIYDEI